LLFSGFFFFPPIVATCVKICTQLNLLL
jgi:hypothetical protein